MLGPYFGMRRAQFSASGLAAVWAEENTRDAIFQSLRRKETYATSGTRIRLRFFGGFDYDVLDPASPDLIPQAYAGGVPMGGDLVADSDAAPRFLVWAQRDRLSAPLQRLQVVKGWYDSGYRKETREQVYDVACADGLEPDLPLDHLGRAAGGRGTQGRGAADDPGTCLVIADLVPRTAVAPAQVPRARPETGAESALTKEDRFDPLSALRCAGSLASCIATPDSLWRSFS